MVTRKCRNIYFPKYFMAVRMFTNMVRNGDQKLQEYLFSKIFYGRQEVHKYLSYPEILCFSVNPSGPGGEGYRFG